MNIGVTPVNDAPVAVADSITVAEGGTATVLVGGATSVLANDSDAENNTLSAILVSGPANGTLTLNANGTFSYTHNGSETTTDSFTYKVNDGTVDGNTVTVNIGVTPVNDAPQTDNVSANGDEDSLITITLSGSDSDGSIAGYLIKTLPANGTLYSDAAMTTAVAVDTLVSGSVYFMPGANWNGSTSFTYAAQDDLGSVDATPATATITVNAVNTQPLANDDPMVIQLTAGFKDGINYTWNTSFITSISASGGTLLAGNADGVFGSIGVAGSGSTAELDGEIQNGESILVTLAAPVLSASFGFEKLDFGGVPEKGLWIVRLNGVEVGRGQFNAVDASRMGTVAIKDASGNAIAFDQIQFDTATTGSDYVVTWLTVERTPATVQEGMSIAIPVESGVLVNDSDSDGGILTVVGVRTGGEATSGSTGTLGVALQGTYGKLTLNSNGSYTYIADDIADLNPGQVGKDYFTYTVSDGQGGTNQATLSISVFGAGSLIDTSGGSGASNGSNVNGTPNNDILVGTSGSDVIRGLAGDDLMTGGLGADTFKWAFGDEHRGGGIAKDTILDFSVSQGDVLHLSELLQSENSSNLTNYLHFTYAAGQATTTVHISSNGGYSSGYNASTTDQKIELKGIQLTGTDQEIINQLKSAGNLITD